VAKVQDARAITMKENWFIAFEKLCLELKSKGAYSIDLDKKCQM